jgi:hypothetical protein
VVEFLLLIARVLVAWCGVSLLVLGLWMLIAAGVPRRDRLVALSSVGLVFLGGLLVVWGVRGLLV